MISAGFRLNIEKYKKEIRENPDSVTDVKLGEITEKELYDRIMEHGGSYDIIGGLHSLI